MSLKTRGGFAGLHPYIYIYTIRLVNIMPELVHGVICFTECTEQLSDTVANLSVDMLGPWSMTVAGISGSEGIREHPRANIIRACEQVGCREVVGSGQGLKKGLTNTDEVQ